VNEEQNCPAAQVADLWSRKLDEGADFSSDVYWLAVPEVYRHYILRATRGLREDSWVDYCVSELLAGQTPLERILSIGCGNGGLERHLARCSAFRECDAWDIAPGAIETARRLAREEGCHGIHYEVRDANATGFGGDPEARYDAVWFNSSLHHIEELESACEAVARSLKPGGWLFLHEYVGPSVFALTPRQQEVIRAAFDLIPRRFRRRPDLFDVAEAPGIPSPAEVAATDPSEAVRSADILGVVDHYFDVVECNPAGGTVLQFLLHGIAGNFRSEDPDSMAVLDLLLRIETTLIDIGDLGSDFVVLAARRRDTPAPPRTLQSPRPVPSGSPAEPEVSGSAGEARLRAEVERLQATIQKMASTRVWRAAHLYWAARRRLRSWLDRRQS
jgi:SAM-dependent methyltransferase